MAMIDNVSASNLFSESRLNQRQVEVPLVTKPFQEPRGLVQCDSQFLSRNPPRGRFFYDYVPVDATIPDMSSETFGEPFAATKRPPRNGDDRHFIMARGKRPAKWTET